MTHFDHLGILHDSQHGFRKGRSWESQLVLAIHDLAKGIDDGSKIDAVLLDFSNAFDNVPHQRLLHKLSLYGVRGDILKWISAFLSNRTQSVLCEGSIGYFLSSASYQWSSTRPLLFLAYINDLWPDPTKWVGSCNGRNREKLSKGSFPDFWHFWDDFIFSIYILLTTLLALQEI